MQNIISFFKENGDRLEPRGNKPILLKNQDHIYLVTEGNIDIFSVEAENNFPISARKNIMRLTPYRLFTGFDQKNGIKEQLLIVGSQNSAIYRISIEAFSQMLDKKSYYENALWLLEEWINRFFYRIFTPFQAQDYIDLISSIELPVDENKNVMCKNRFIWVRQIEGESAVCGDEKIVISPGDIAPVSQNIYIQTNTSGKLKRFTSQELHQQGQLWESLEAVYAMAAKKIALSRADSIDQERKRINKREKLKQITLKKGIFKLVNILQPVSKRKFEEHFDADSDGLLACCNLIGKKLKLKFVLPPALPDGMDKKEKLTEIVRASRVRIRKVILSYNWWKNDNGPLLSFHKENNHPIALLPKSPRQYYYIDLISHEKRIVNEALANQLEDFAYYFYRPFPEKPLTWLDLIKFGTFRNYTDLIVVVLVGTAGVLLGLLNPYLTGLLFDKIIPSASMNELNQMIYILISAAIAISVFELTRAVAMLRFEGKIDRDLQSALWDRLLSLPIPFFKKYTAGDLAERSLGISSIRRVLSGITIQSILTGFFSVFYLIQLFSYNVNLALVALGLGFFVLILTSSIGYLFVRSQMPINVIEGQISGMVLQFINGISKIRVTGTEDYAFQFWANKFSEKKRLAFKAGLAQSALRCITSIFPTIASMIIFSYIIYQIPSKAFSIGDFAGYYSAYGQFQNSLLQMAIYATSSLYMLPMYEMLKPIISHIPEVDQTKAKPKELNGNVSINDIDFRYEADGPLVLHNLSLEIESGEFVALVGQSGCGKSTLIRMMLGFETPEAGSILYDNQDLFNVDIREIRKQIGVVLQNSQIMQGSILENIIGSSNLTIDHAWQAAEMAGISEDIKEMPMNMHTVVPFAGGTLSGGQRQRILIARALVRKPRLIIFDEATSALDNRTQKIVSESLERLNATRIVVAHRLSTVKNADKICFLDQGTIVEKGTFAELMERNGLFANLAKRQLL